MDGRDVGVADVVCGGVPSVADAVAVAVADDCVAVLVADAATGPAQTPVPQRSSESEMRLPWKQPVPGDVSCGGNE